MARIVIFLIFVLHMNVHAAETDGFTDRYRTMPDGIPMMNEELQRHINLALDQLNKDNIAKTCDWDALNSALGSQLRRPVIGILEEFVNKSTKLPKVTENFDTSIYRYFPVYFNLTVKLGIAMGLGYSPAVPHKGLLIGGDKFGHFMDEGYYYYTLVNTWNQPVDKIVVFGTATENTINGRWSSGIYSYADLAANYDGMRFWTDVLGTTKQRDSKYFSCENGAWKQKASIDFDHYISAAWDEGMNCNDFRNSGMYTGLETAVRELEQKSGKRYHCPVYPEKVLEMVMRYHPYSEKILHPSLLKMVDQQFTEAASHVPPSKKVH